MAKAKRNSLLSVVPTTSLPLRGAGHRVSGNQESGRAIFASVQKGRRASILMKKKRMK